MLLLADESGDRKRQKDVVIANMLNITPQAVHGIKLNFLERSDADTANPGKGIRRKKRETPPVPAKCTGDIEARIIAIACSTPPEGYSRWTLRLISERAVLDGTISSYREFGLLPQEKVIPLEKEALKEASQAVNAEYGERLTNAYAQLEYELILNKNHF